MKKPTLNLEMERKIHDYDLLNNPLGIPWSCEAANRPFGIRQANEH